MPKTVMQTLTIANGAALSDAIYMGDSVGDAGMIYVPGAWTAASIGFQIGVPTPGSGRTSPGEGTEPGTYVPLRDETGSIVQISGILTASPGWYKLPDALRGAGWVKAWSQNAGTDANQGASRALIITIKA